MAPEGASPDLDRVLVTAFQAGDDQAFDEIFKRYHHRVGSVCSRMLRSPQDVEEATQETFLKAYQALGRFNGNFYLGAWLSRIATNVCVDHLRSKSRSNLVALPEDQDDISVEPGPEELVVGQHPRLERAIQEIQPLHARALALRAVEGMSHQEIAGRLRMSPSQVKALLHRARGSLRRAWDKAEGWALAPLVGFRYMFNDRATADAGRLASVTPSAAPFLLERVAASAMLVAAAIGGVVASDTPPEAPAETRTPSAVAAVPPRLESFPASQESTKDAAPHTQAPVTGDEAEAEGAIELAAPGDLVTEVEKALKDRPAPEAPDHGTEESKGGPIGPGAAEGDKVVKKVRKTVETVKDTVLP